MLIPRPKFEPIEKDFRGLGFWARIKKELSSPPRFRLTEDWLITLDNGVQIVVPKGFVTDFASVPRIFWMIPGFSPYGPLLWGSILHDFGYQHGYLLTPYVKGLPYPIKSINARLKYSEAFASVVPIFIGRKREFFDNLMSGMVVEKTDARQVAKIARKALSWFGPVAWNKYRKLGPGAYHENSLNLPGMLANMEWL